MSAVARTPGSRTGLRGRVASALSLLTLLGAGIVPAPAAASANSSASSSAALPLASTVWLCRPGVAANPCNQDLSGNPQRGTAGTPFTQRYLGSGHDVTLDATTITTAGAVSVEPFTAPAVPAVDCFSVYPTVDLTPNPLLQLGSLPPVANDTHLAVTLTQVARFSRLCRMFVPVYRQAPLLNLAVGVLTGTSTDYSTGAMDIANAWTDYWDHFNTDPVTHERRGVILLGHSQGSADLITLLQQRFDGDTAEREQLVAAYLLGGNVQVANGPGAAPAPDPASTFQDLPSCERSSTSAPMPTGCIVAYSSYASPDGQAPAPDALFGRNTAPDHRILCVNPAALLAGSASDAALPLDAYLPTNRLLEGTVVLPNGHLSLVLSGFTLQNRPTGFVRYPDTLTGQCRVQSDGSGTASWLQVTGGAALFPSGSSTSELGLHVVDYNVALGDLTQLAAQQSQHWTATQ
ncbi:DUF3089 domain-containing protein [Streptosporangium sp. NPDC002544]|uniref:DUF3089 domain-containing protein n=1 Tax=Streptosporangium sp. NPDC002544 TaxID=3154538 RepID=UPI0033300AF7